MAVNPDLDIWFDCNADNYAGIIFTGNVILTGYSLNRTVEGEITLGAVLITGRVAPYTLVRGEANKITLNPIYLIGEPVIEQARFNWVGWSKIGSIVFKQDLTNDSGYRQLPWKGVCFCVKKLGKSVVAYGTGGVTVFYPVSNPAPTFGMKELLNVGVLNKNCVCGDDRVHFFISKDSHLWKISEKGDEDLGYEEFLKTLSNPVMHYDHVKGRVYISDPTKGFTYTPLGLGGGYANLTGIGYIEGSMKVMSPATLAAPPAMLLVTDILDFGYRGMKTLESVQVGTDALKKISVAIDFRYNMNEKFKTSPFVATNREGVAIIPVMASEFRIRLKNAAYDPIDIDYLRINFKRSDLRFANKTPGVSPVSEERYDN